MFAKLYDVFLPAWCLLNWMMPAQLYDVCSFVWGLPTCRMSALLHDVFLPAWCPLTCMVSANLYVWCLLYCMMSFYLDVFLSVWCLQTFMSVQLYNVCYLYDVFYLHKLCLPTYMKSAHLYDVCLLVWCLPTCKMSVNLNDILLIIPPWYGHLKLGLSTVYVVCSIAPQKFSIIFREVVFCFCQGNSPSRIVSCELFWAPQWKSLFPLPLHVVCLAKWY
jgi:hypothetical protein